MTLRASFRASWSGVVVVAGLAFMPAGVARGAEPSTAEALFREGRELLSRGDYAAACPKLAESQRLDPAPGTEFNLARCYELLGKLASAWGAYADVAEVTHTLGQKERETRARERVAAIEPRLSFVVVNAASPPDGLRLRRDGAEMSLAQLDVAIPIDAGDHILTADAPGRRAWEVHFQVTREAERVTVDVPALEAIPFAEEATAPGPPGSAAPTAANDSGRGGGAPATDLHADTAAPASTTRGSAQRTIALGLLGASLVSAGFGTYFGIEHIQNGNDVRAGIDAKSNYQSAHTNGDLSDATFIGFGVLAVAGGILWFTAPRAPKSAPGARVSITLTGGLGGAGAVVSGVW